MHRTLPSVQVRPFGMKNGRLTDVSKRQDRYSKMNSCADSVTADIQDIIVRRAQSSRHHRSVFLTALSQVEELRSNDTYRPKVTFSRTFRPYRLTSA